jgi:ubiquinone biosynthesis protein COQ4
MKAVLDPTKATSVAGFNDAVNTSRFTSALLERLRATEPGRQILSRKPIISTETLSFSKLIAQSENTLGYAYAKYMSDHSFSPDERAVVRFTTNEDLGYVSARYRQVHDFWHVLTDLPPTLLGEVALKAFEAAHTKLPSALVSASVGVLSLSSKERTLYASHYLPWAMRVGAECKELLAFAYEDRLQASLEDVRKELRISVAPTPLTTAE